MDAVAHVICASMIAEYHSNRAFCDPSTRFILNPLSVKCSATRLEYPQASDDVLLGAV